MTSADYGVNVERALLRKAVALMRLNAEDADDGHRWRAEGSYVDTDPECGFNAGTSLIADHVASWHPTVALAVADLLEADATPPFGPTRYAVAVARAYLERDE